MIKLESERLIIRDYKKDDLLEYFELANRYEDLKYTPNSITKTINDARNNVDMAIRESQNKERTKYWFVIRTKNNNQYVGAVGYSVIEKNENGKVVDLGYFIKSEYWNLGYTTEAAKTVMEFAFNIDGVIKIEAGCNIENKKSERVMIKCSMKKEGELKQHQFYNGEWKNRLLYGITKQEWLSKRIKFSRLVR
jgi:[ribosomal protein S5]-alanine N-acetyltransferase